MTSKNCPNKTCSCEYCHCPNGCTESLKRDNDESDYDERLTSLEETNIETRLLNLESKLEQLDATDSFFKVIEFNFKDKIGVDLLVESDDKPVIERLTKLENRFPNLKYESLTEIENKLTEIETGLDLVRALGSRSFHPKKPYKCPVCEGTGGVKHPLTGMIMKAVCQSCSGTGVLWG